MPIKLISIARPDAKKWKTHAADDRGYPLCGIKKKEGTPVIPGTVKLECERCRDAILRLKSEPSKAGAQPV